MTKNPFRISTVECPLCKRQVAFLYVGDPDDGSGDRCELCASKTQAENYRKITADQVTAYKPEVSGGKPES